MMVSRWSQLMGMGSRPRRWERPLILFAALCALDFVWLILAPSWASRGGETGYSLSLFNIPPAGVWVELLLGNLLLAVLAAITFGLIRNIIAIPVLAFAYSLLWSGVLYLLFVALAPEGLDASPYWDSYSFLTLSLNFAWGLLFFGLLELAMRLIKSLPLAIFTGALATTLLLFPINYLVSTLFLGADGPRLLFRLLNLPFNLLGNALLALILWGGLRLSSGPGPLDQAPFEPRISRRFYLGTLAATQGMAVSLSLAVLVILWFTNAWEVRNLDDTIPIFLLLGLAVLLAIYGTVVFCHLIYKMWETIQDGYVRTTPGWAVGGLFIPFYNFYWAFQVFPGFVTDYYAFGWRHGLYIPRLSQGVFTAYVIICIASVLPYVNLLLLPAAYVMLLVMASEICKAVNAVPVVPPAFPPQVTWTMPPPAAA